MNINIKYYYNVGKISRISVDMRHMICQWSVTGTPHRQMQQPQLSIPHSNQTAASGSNKTECTPLIAPSRAPLNRWPHYTIQRLRDKTGLSNTDQQQQTTKRNAGEEEKLNQMSKDQAYNNLIAWNDTILSPETLNTRKQCWLSTAGHKVQLFSCHSRAANGFQPDRPTQKGAEPSSESDLTRVCNH